MLAEGSLALLAIQKEKLGSLTLAAVKVGKSKDISCAALGAAVQTRARHKRLALLELAGRGGHGRDGEDGDGEELHID
jgi:hypothetical protein